MSRLFIFLGVLLIVSCNANPPEPLPGKILTHPMPFEKCLVYSNSDTAFVEFSKTSKLVEIDPNNWFNKRDAFIGVEYIIGRSSREFEADIVEIDLKGKVVNKIYNGSLGEIIGPQGLSKDDKYLAFTSNNANHDTLNPLEGLVPMVSLIIMDINENKIVTQIDSIGRIPNFNVCESPWIYNAYKLVYSIIGGTKVMLAQDQKLINPVSTAEGVYILDILSGKRQLIVPEAHQAAASPTANKIVYRRKNSIRVLDLDTNIEKIIYTHRANQNILSIHWTPLGDCIYIAYTNRSRIADLFNTHGEKLINITTLKEKPFKSIGHGFGSFTWK